MDNVLRGSSDMKLSHNSFEVISVIGMMITLYTQAYCFVLFLKDFTFWMMFDIHACDYN